MKVSSRYKEVLGLGIEQTDSAKFWLRAINVLRACGAIERLNASVHTVTPQGPLPERSGRHHDLVGAAKHH